VKTNLYVVAGLHVLLSAGMAVELGKTEVDDVDCSGFRVLNARDALL
jgi:hypothetical protein